MLRATWEDVVLAICAPRSGKTTCLAVPAVLDAPGPVIATSNKADLWQHTAAVRAADTGQRVWTFDPQHITGTTQTFVWDALAGVTTVADARRLAGHFTAEIRRTPDTGDFWDRDAEDLLTGLLLAAALAEAGLAKVGQWLTSISAVEPRNILTRGGFTQLADVMTGRSHGAHETREGVYATARAAAACLSDPDIMAWVTPRPGLDLFDPAAFVRSRQSLHLLSKDGAGSAAPLVAAFTDRLLLDAVRAAEHSPAGRLDPPLVAVLDEAANICRITELPRLYSHLGSRGVVPVTILQSRSQGRRVWGEAGHGRTVLRRHHQTHRRRHRRPPLRRRHLPAHRRRRHACTVPQPRTQRRRHVDHHAARTGPTRRPGPRPAQVHRPAPGHRHPTHPDPAHSPGCMAPTPTPSGPPSPPRAEAGRA